ncbi:baculoviral IAP repeat-containing protein 2-like [Mercenaria mercenaria]|uniref:baculoviral IAP repeat-containing protein 2-like n=1 Tax=Mercenaria mercenaria TaxID=6596 RepID=UPI00234FA34A|nr:baculoviral IAP repeat-containing protein 2-like [Mercenaria mercenaria]
MAEARTEEDDSLPTPDLPSYISNISIDGTSGTSFVSLSMQYQRPSITIRTQQVHYIARGIHMVSPRSDPNAVYSLHPSPMQNIHEPIARSHLLMHEFPETTLNHRRRETSEDSYRRRLRTFRHWRVSFLDPEVLAEASFCYTGAGDTVRCTICGGELSNWQPGDNPRQEHFKEFGFFCH